MTISEGKFKLGGVEFEIDPKDCAKSLSAAQKLTAPQVQKIAIGASFPIEPFSKQLVLPLILGLVQIAWHRAFRKEVPELLETNQTKRVDRYKQQLAELLANDGADLVVSRKAVKEPKAPKPSHLYRLTTVGAAAKIAGQKFVIVQSLIGLGAGPGGKGISIRQLSEGLKEFPGIIPPSHNNCTFHMNAFAKSELGYVERVEADGSVAVAEKPAEPTKPAAKTPPAAKEKTPAKKK